MDTVAKRPLAPASLTCRQSKLPQSDLLARPSIPGFQGAVPGMLFGNRIGKREDKE